jgi:hypothetical protein
MPTDKQIEASKKNGAKSNGPVTEEGKQNSSKNARRHGLSSNSHVVVLSNEDRGLYKEMLQSFYDTFQPANAVEMDLVQQIAAASWRIRRINGMESAMLELEMDRQRDTIANDFEFIDETTRQALAIESAAKSGGMALLHRYDSRARRAYNQALRNLLDLQRERLSRQPVQPPVQPSQSTTQADPPNQPEPLTAESPEPVSFVRRSIVNTNLPNEPGIAAPPLTLHAGLGSPILGLN